MSASAIRGYQSNGALSFSPGDVLIAIGITAQFLLLRILDEHKDFKEDCMNYPDRALQSGVITLADLRKIGAGCVGFMFALSLFSDQGMGRAMFAWFLMTAWTLLMFKEFFCSEWLRARLFLYAVSHMLIMPLVMLWIVALCAKSVASTSPIVLLLMALTLISGFAFEITRKTKGKDEERAAVDSYSQRIGSSAASSLILALIPVIFFIQFSIVRALEIKYAPIFLALSLLGALLSALSVLAYRKDPTAAGRKKNEGATGLFMLLNYLSLIIGPAITHGWKWT